MVDQKRSHYKPSNGQPQVCDVSITRCRVIKTRARWLSVNVSVSAGAWERHQLACSA